MVQKPNQKATTGVDRWLSDLERRLPLTDLERTAIKVVRHNPLILELLALEFVPLDELADWLRLDREAFQKRLDEVIELNIEWQEAYEKVWQPKLNKLRKLEAQEENRRLKEENRRLFDLLSRVRDNLCRPDGQ